MTAFSDNLARLRVAAATGAMPRDLARWAAEELTELAPIAERIEARNALLRRAAALMSGSTWSRARRIEQEMRRGAPTLRVRSADQEGVRELVGHALEMAPAPAFRTLRRIIG